jgi:hypothetical protein
MVLGSSRFPNRCRIQCVQEPGACPRIGPWHLPRPAPGGGTADTTGGTGDQCNLALPSTRVGSLPRRGLVPDPAVRSHVHSPNRCRPTASGPYGAVRINAPLYRSQRAGRSYLRGPNLWPSSQARKGRQQPRHDQFSRWAFGRPARTGPRSHLGLPKPRSDLIEVPES